MTKGTLAFDDDLWTSFKDVTSSEACGNKTGYPSLLVNKFQQSGMLLSVNHISLYTHKQEHFSISSSTEMCYFHSVSILVNTFVCCHIYCQTVVHAKEKKWVKKEPKTHSISLEK